MDVDNSRIMGYFPTPDGVIRTMLEQVEIEIDVGDYILEPSAGKGSIVDALSKEYPDAVIHCIEWNNNLRQILELKDYTVICDDVFAEALTTYHHKYKLIVMNPPWGKEYGAAEDARHILHCYENFLADDGQLISVVSASAVFNQNKDYAKFREFVDENGYFVDVPQGAFKNADRSTGTSVKIVVLDKRSESVGTPKRQPQIEEPKPVDMHRLILDLDMTRLRSNAAGAKVDLNLRTLGYAKDSDMLDKHILDYAAIRARRCILPVFTAKLIGLPEAELQRLVDEERLATVKLQSGQTAYHITWQGASYTIYLWEHLKPKIDKFLDWYITEPQGISESVIRDLEEAIALMKQIHDANNTKTEWYEKQQPQTVLKVDDRVFIPHMNEHGTITEVVNNGASLRLMLDSGIAMQTRAISIKPSIEEENPKSSNKQVQNSVQDSPVDDSPKVRQLELFG
jgi:predicted RNA methylase